MNKELVLREAVDSDLLLLFEWTNDPQTRKNSFSTNPIPLSDHKVWFERTIENPTRHLLILEVNGSPVGQVRLDVDKNIGTISYSIAPQYRGMGYGKVILESLEQHLPQIDKEVYLLRGDVKDENMASRKIFERLEYELEEQSSQENGVCHYRKIIKREN